MATYRVRVIDSTHEAQWVYHITANDTAHARRIARGYARTDAKYIGIVPAFSAVLVKQIASDAVIGSWPY